MGKLVTDLLQCRLADELGHEGLVGLIGDLTVGVVVGTRGHQAEEHIGHLPHLGARPGRAGQDVGEGDGQVVLQPGDAQQVLGQPFGTDQIGLGHDRHQGRRLGEFGELGCQVDVAGTDVLIGREHERHHIDL